MKGLLLTLIASVILFLFNTTSALSQWTDNPLINTTICGNQFTSFSPQIISTPEGKFVTIWFGGENNLNLNMQLLYPDGTEVWPHNGVVLSSFPLETIFDRFLLLDHEDNIVIGFLDLRSGNSLPVVYKVSQDGSLLFGDGVQPVVNNDINIFMTICITSDNEIVIAWEILQESGKFMITAHRISSSGELLWGTGVELQSPDFDYRSPVVIADDSDGVILGYYKQTGPIWSCDRSIYAQRYDRDGNPVWQEEVTICNEYGIPSFDVVRAIPDGEGGAIFYWVDDRDHNIAGNPAIQRIHPSGTVFFPENGVEIALFNGTSYETVVVAGMNDHGEIIAFCTTYTDADNDRGGYGLIGQKINPMGNRKWGDYGKLLMPLTNNFNHLFCATLHDDVCYGVYSYYNDLMIMTNAIYALAIDYNGDRIWETDALLASSFTEKHSIGLSSCTNDQMAVIWQDNDSTSRIIKAQNFHTDGSLGNPPVAVYNHDMNTANNIFICNNTLYIRDESKVQRIDIFNLKGQLIKQFHSFGTALNLNAIPAGIYIAVAYNKSDSFPEVHRIPVTSQGR